MPDETEARDPRVYLAEERTFLAWIRTGLSLMGFGFVVARFGLFLREMEASRTGLVTQPSSFSLPAGVALVLLGVLVNLLAAVRHVKFVRALNRGTPDIGRPSRLGIAVAGLLAVAGLAMAVYLSSRVVASSDPPAWSCSLTPGLCRGTLVANGQECIRKRLADLLHGSVDGVLPRRKM